MAHLRQWSLPEPRRLPNNAAQEMAFSGGSDAERHTDAETRR
jgi:hypothetical protein